MLQDSLMSSVLSETGVTKKVAGMGFISSENLYALILFLLPLFFLPYTADVLVLNKTYLVIFGAVISLLIFFVTAYRQGKLRIFGIKSYGWMSLLAFGAIISTIFSRNRTASIYGTFGNYNNSLIFILSLLVIGFVSTNSNLKLSKLLKSFMAGVTVTSAFSLLIYLGASLPFFGQTGREFTLVGSTYGLAGLQVVSLLSAIYYIGRFTNSDKKSLLAYLLTVIAINGAFLVASHNVYAIGVLVVGFVFLVNSGHVNFRKNLGYILPAAVVIVLFALINNLPVTKEAFGIKPYQESLRLPLLGSWRVSALAATDFPLTGAGYGMFGRIFSLYRPASLNLTNLWQIRFNSPFNDVFLWLAEGGVIGVSIFLAFWAFVYKNIKIVLTKSEKGFFIGFLIAVIFGLLMLLGGNPILYVLLFIALGVLVAEKGEDEVSIAVKDFSLILSGLSLVIIFGVAYHAYGVYAAQVKFAQSFKTNDAIERYNLQRQAMAFDKLESQYRKQNVLTSLFIAQQLSQQKNLDKNGTTQINQLVSESVLDARRLTELIDPLDVANWELRASVYNSLSGVVDKSDDFAISAYNNAISLDPTNPKLWVGIGSIYYRTKAYQNAVQSFARAVQLKNDYANAHYNLGLALKDAGSAADAVTQLEIVQRLIPADSPDAKKVAEDLKTVKAMADEQKKAKADALIVDQQTPDVKSPLSKQDKLTAPTEKGNLQIEPKKDITVPEEVLNPTTDSKGVKNVPTDVQE